MYNNSLYDGLPVGIRVRGHIKKEVIFRVRVGNGYFGTVAGKLYQDRYPYFVPSSIDNPEGQPARDAFSQAINEWRNVLTEEEKNVYRERAKTIDHMFGYHLYLSERIKEILGS